MARKKKPDSGGPSNAYLISFGDTMTALLAFFIVINSLAREQTGANLHSGTGSFVNAMNSMGLPGNYNTESSENAFQKKEPGPLYVVSDEDQPERGKGTGPDDEGNNLRVVDREKEVLQRFINEMGQLGDTSKLPSVKNEVVFDIFEPIRDKSPVVTGNTVNLFRQAVMQLDGKTRIEIIVWATTPGVSAWNRAVVESIRLRSYLTEQTGLSGASVRSVIATGKPWFFSDQKRPRFSIIVTKLK